MRRGAWTWAVVAFLSELAAVTALGWWGWSAGGWPLSLALVLAAVALWALFAAPRAPVHRPVPALAVKVLVFGSAVAALFALGSPVLAVVLALAAVLGSVLSPTPEELAGPRVRG